MDEGRNPPRVAGMAFERVPERVIADIASGIAGRIRIQSRLELAGQPQPHGQCERREPAVLCAGGDRARLRPYPPASGKNDIRLRAPRLDPDVRACAPARPNIRMMSDFAPRSARG
jgi:hypothetical protein